MSDENRYEPYQYGRPQEPQFEEPDLDEVKEVNRELVPEGRELITAK